MNTIDELPLIDVKDAVFGYEGCAVVRVDRLSLRRRQCLGIFGPNGAGKTTLVRGITGLLTPIEGHVNREASKDNATAPMRIGYLPQHRAIELHWPMTGVDAASIASSAWGRFGWVGRDARRSISDAMRRLDVGPLATKPFAKMSGGQQQRLLLAGALAAKPQVLVLDEPTDGLDVRSQQALLALLRELTAEGLCTAIISHEVEDLLQLCHEVAWLHPAEDGKQASHVEIIAPEDLADRMLHARSLGGAR